jgi:hypothetical protein
LNTASVARWQLTISNTVIRESMQAGAFCDILVSHPFDRLRVIVKGVEIKLLKTIRQALSIEKIDGRR